MTITQDIFGFTPEEEGEAVIIYTLTNTSGASAQVTNMGAALVSVMVPGRDGVSEDVVTAPAPLLVNRVWEGRVESNRVVFSITDSGRPGPGELIAEVAYHWSDENELEILFSAECDAPREIDFVPRTGFNLAENNRCFTVADWQKNILAEAGTVSDETTGRRLTVLTSLPRICIYGSKGESSRPNSGDGSHENLQPETITPGERHIRKIVHRFSTF